MTAVPTSTLEGFITLFRGRGDVYGSWDGGCVKRPLTVNQFRSHLEGGERIGVYPSIVVNGVASCVWGCSDIDYDSYEEASTLRDVLAAVDVKAWIEKTRKGYHVWVFSQGLVPSEHMRNMFLAAHHVAQTPPKEVNPKQFDLSNGKIGNYVRLPYPNGYDATERRVLAGGNEAFMRLNFFVESAMECRTEPATITNLASYYTPPTRHEVVVGEPSGDLKSITDRLTPLAWTIFRAGPLEGRDRSTTLAHLAHECVKSGLSPADTMQVVTDADMRWGKYVQRGADGILELEKLVTRVHGGA